MARDINTENIAIATHATPNTDAQLATGVCPWAAHLVAPRAPRRVIYSQQQIPQAAIQQKALVVLRLVPRLLTQRERRH